MELWTTDGTYLGYKRLDDLLEPSGFDEYDLDIVVANRAFNDGRLALVTYKALYIFDVNLTVSDGMAEDTR